MQRATGQFYEVAENDRVTIASEYVVIITSVNQYSFRKSEAVVVVPEKEDINA